ncbi:hypothetical protein [Flavisolibacter tropicus]|nr:hypothetical protein [Flavisolibacter tropicus]
MPKRLIILLLLILSFQSVFSQQLDSLLAIQQKADPQEKIYIHFDKGYYNPGETIWFKAYLFSGIYPTEVSKTFYTELLDETGKILYQKTAPISFASAVGSFDIDSNFSKPVIYFRSYTLSMLNSDTNFIYTKAIRILSTKESVTKLKSSVTKTRLSFLPEGGDMVAGLPSTVAFISTNDEELPIKIIGQVLDNQRKKVAELKTLHDGMGKFVLTPEAGKTYTATWQDELGKSYSTALPIASSQGVILKINDEEANKRFTLYRTDQAPEEMKQLHVIAYMNQEIAFRADVNLANKLTATGIFPTNTLPSGILRVTVFDNNFKAVLERITFVDNDDYEFDGDVYMVQKDLKKRGLNKVEILISDTIPSNISLSITDADLQEFNPLEDNIVSHLLLTGELRGKIVNPYYYFFINNDSTSFYLDLVMLTHGWRRYNWDNVFAGKTVPLQWKENNYLALNGQISGLPPNSIGPDLQLSGILRTSDSANNFIVLPVDRKGKVFSDGLIFYDKAKLFFNFNTQKLIFDKSMLVLDNGLRKNNTKAWLDSNLKKSLPQLNAAVVTSNNQVNKKALQMRQQVKSITLENVTVQAKTKTSKEKMDEKYTSGLFSGDAYSFDLLNDPFASSASDIFQYLQGKVAGLQISTGGNGPSLSWRGGTPALYLNEMQADASLLSATPVSDIAYIKIFRPGESIVSGGGGGVIAIYTRKGGDVKPDPNTKGLNYVQVMGYSAVKEFYSPNYATVAEKDVEDVRTTLYWNPSIYLDKTKRRIRFQFYNNDITKRFRLVMEGINAAGKLIHVTKEVISASNEPLK